MTISYTYRYNIGVIAEWLKGDYMNEVLIEKAKKNEDGLFFAILNPAYYRKDIPRLAAVVKTIEVDDIARHMDKVEEKLLIAELPFIKPKDIYKLENVGDCKEERGDYDCYLANYEQIEHYIALNESRAKDPVLIQRRKEQEIAKTEREQGVRKQNLMDKIDSWDITSKDIEDEGGWTKQYFHKFRINGEIIILSERNVFDFGVCINPEYSIENGREKGGLSTFENETLYWQDWEDSKGWITVRPLTENELICHELVAFYGKFSKAGIRM